MKEFMMIFKSEINESFGPSPEQMQSNIQQWMDWMGGIAAQGKLTSGNRLSFEGKTLKPNNVIADGPYAATVRTQVKYCFYAFSTLHKFRKT